MMLLHSDSRYNRIVGRRDSVGTIASLDQHLPLYALSVQLSVNISWQSRTLDAVSVLAVFANEHYYVNY